MIRTRVRVRPETCAADSSSAPSRRIGYLRPLGGNEPPYGRLFAVNPDGGGAVDLTPAGYTDVRSFAWSHDGRRVAFSAIQDGDHDPELFVMASSGGDIRRLTDNYRLQAELVAPRSGKRCARTAAARCS